MALSKTTKVWLAGLGGGALVVGGGVLLVTGVGSGAGAVLITSGLATIGGVVGGGMLAGIGVIAAGSATSAAISAAIAHKLIKDPELLDLANRLDKANQLYQATQQATSAQKQEIEELNRQIGEVLRQTIKDKEKLDELKERLIILTHQLQYPNAA